MCVTAGKFAFYSRITPAIHSSLPPPRPCNKGVRGSLFLLSTEIPAARDYEMQSNKAALSPRNAPCLLHSAKVSVQHVWNTGLQFECCTASFACQRRAQSITLPRRGRAAAIWSHEGRNQNTRNYAHVILDSARTWTKPSSPSLDPHPNINPCANVWKLGPPYAGTDE